jgi:hypothetical protein
LTASLACDGTFRVHAASGEVSAEFEAPIVDSTRRLQIAYLDERGNPTGSFKSPGRPAGT